jgi:hypothetical protein
MLFSCDALNMRYQCKGHTSYWSVDGGVTIGKSEKRELDADKKRGTNIPHFFIFIA